MRRFLPAATPILWLITNHAGACSFAPGFETARPTGLGIERIEDEQFPPPLLVPLLQRGSDDGNYASCSDAGVLTFILRERTNLAIGGYELVLVDGEFPSADLFPDSPILPVDLGDDEVGFRFVWLDLPYGRSTLEPIDVTIEIRRLSRATVSKPITIHIEHQGGSARVRRPASYEIQFERPVD